MEQITREKETTPKSKWQSILAVIIVLLSILIVINAFLITFVFLKSESAKTSEMVLRNLSDDLVVLAATEEDLEQAKDLSKKLMKSAIQGKNQAGQEKIEDMGQLMLSERVVEVGNGTSCLLLESKPRTCKVQLTEGEKKGQTFWVYKEFVYYPQEKVYTVADVFSKIFIRYFITAFICATGIYFLKIRSIFLQIVSFILGCIVLNLLWVRIVSHFIF